MKQIVFFFSSFTKLRLLLLIEDVTKKDVAPEFEIEIYVGYMYYTDINFEYFGTRSRFDIRARSY